MTDRDEWLRRTTEEALEPELPICDPHHHLWEFPGSRYLVSEFLQDLRGGHGITSTVFVECEQHYRRDGDPALRPVGETEFVDRLAAESATHGGLPRIAAGIVGFADLTLGAAVQKVLEAHLRASKRFRGIRYATAWDASEKIHNAHTNPGRSLLSDRAFRAGFECLVKLGLSFDAWLFHPQLHELVELARAFPAASIVLNHMAGPLGIGPYADRREEVFASWHSDMTELAQCRNVTVKLGGRTMTMSGYRWHKRNTPVGSVELAEAMGPYYHACIELFGVKRCMFESNFPVDKASCTYTVLWNAFKRLTQSYSDAERRDLFHDTAVRVYRLGG